MSEAFKVGDKVLPNGRHKILPNQTVADCFVARIQDFVDVGGSHKLYVVEWKDEHGKIHGEAYEAGALKLA